MHEIIYYVYANNNLVKRTGLTRVTEYARDYAIKHPGYEVKVFAEYYPDARENKRQRRYVSGFHYPTNDHAKESRYY